MLLDDEELERVTTTQVVRGLYLLKYVSGSAFGSSPLAMARPSAGSEPYIEVISAPGVVSGFLARPGEALVVRAERPGDLSIKLLRQSTDASFEASFRLELVFAGEGAAPSVTVRATEEGREEAAAAAGKNLRLCAHVARRGDVEIAAAQWVAGPAAPAAIEGVEIRGLLPAGVRIDTQVLVATNPPRWLDWTPTGAFAGTRGRAMALAGIRFKLVGNAAGRFVICADGLFLGAAIVTKRGAEIELVGSGAADPLVGLRLDLAPVGRAEVSNEPRLSVAAVNSAILEQRNEPRVRVFRAQSGV